MMSDTDKIIIIKVPDSFGLFALNYFIANITFLRYPGTCQSVSGHMQRLWMQVTSERDSRMRTYII